MLTIYATQLNNATFLGLAWAYVAMRITHSSIHCTYNRVMHRFSAYAASLAVLCDAVGACLAFDLVVRGGG